MLTFGELCKDPALFATLGGDDLLVTAAGSGEVLAREPERRREATVIFQHETIQMMRAGRAETVDKLLTLVGKGSEVVRLCKKPESLWDNITVGRASTADVVIDDPAISSVHANFAIDYGDGSCSVEDVGSSNGTFLNRQQLQPHTPVGLKAGDCLRFGQSVFYYLTNSMLAELVTAAQSKSRR
ncbi:MAG: FHA domain-containing protein [Deltaproteobacteria bacterium]|nr:FHA domain-containing protein [Deltaproteobacteria bacterium]